MARIIIPAWKRWGRRLAIVPALAMIAAFAVAIPAQALDDFESADANFTHNSATDWNDFAHYNTKVLTSSWDKDATPPAFTSVTPDIGSPVAGFDQLTWLQDRAGNPDDIYGGGTKQDANCPGTKNGSLGGSDSGKFDIDRVYLTHHKDTSNKDYLFLAWVRVPQNSTTASSHIAYEFNRGTDVCPTGSTDSAGDDGNPPPISRISGDRLLVFDFEGGTNTSTSPTLKLLTWLVAGDSLSGSCEVASSRPCWGAKINLNTAGVSDAAVNTTEISSPQHDGVANKDAATVEFGEAGINLSAPELGIDVCDFAGHVTAVARSSGNSGTAQMKDKVGPAVFTLPGCTQETTITSEVSLDDHATVNNFDHDFTGDHKGDLTFTLYGPEDANCDGKLDSDTTQDATPRYTTTIADIDGSINTAVDPDRPWSTEDGDNTSSFYVVPHTFEDQGTYNWVVTYEGDSANDPSSSGCGKEAVDVDYGIAAP